MSDADNNRHTAIMRTVRTKVYKFSELSDQAKQKAMDKMWDINICHEWWDGVYYDAGEIGLKITGFDIDRGSYCSGEFMYNADDVAARILDSHGDICETYKTAKTFLADIAQAWEELPELWDEEAEEDTNEYERNERIEEIEEGFLKSLCEDYLTILRKEYEYMTSEEAILETIEANDYEFYQDGRMY